MRQFPRIFESDDRDDRYFEWVALHKKCKFHAGGCEKRKSKLDSGVGKFDGGALITKEALSWRVHHARRVDTFLQFYYKRYLKPLGWVEPSDLANALFSDSKCLLNT